MTETQELLALCDAWYAAIVSNDPESIGSFMSDDWIIAGANGITDKPAFLEWVESGDLTHDAMQRLDGGRVAVYGETAVVTVRITNSGHYKGHPFSADEWTTDVFLKREDRWLCVASHITAVQTP